MVLLHASKYLAVEYIVVGKFSSYGTLDAGKGKILLSFHVDYDGLFVGKTTCDVLDAFNRYEPMNF